MFDKDQNSLQLIFDNLLEDVDLECENIIPLDVSVLIVKQLTHFKSKDLALYPHSIQQLYILYLISNLLSEHLQIKYDIGEDKNNHVLNMISILYNYFPDIRTNFTRDINTTYGQVKKTCSNIVEYHIHLLHTESKVIQNDILNIFLKKIFKYHNPLSITNIREYYCSIFRYLFLNYLKDKSDGLFDDSIDPFISKEEKIIEQSKRIKTYNDGLKITEIANLCRDSDTLNRINSQYNKFKYKILANELQVIYHLLVNKEKIDDPNILLLKVSDNISPNLLKIKEKCPFMYKLLRCIHIDDGKTIDNKIMQQLYKSIYGAFYIHFNGKFDDDFIIPIITKISSDLTNSLSKGSYIDVLSLEVMDIENLNFVIHTKTFFNMILEEIDRSIYVNT